MPRALRTSLMNWTAGSYAAVFVGMILQNLLLFVFSVLVASYFGTSGDVDAFLTALVPPTMFSAMLSNTGGPLLITLLSDTKGSHEERSAACLLIFLLLGLAITGALLGACFPDAIMTFLHGGFDAERRAENAKLFQILVWVLPLNTLLGLFQSVLHANLRFLIPSLAGVFGPLLTVGLLKFWGKSHGLEGVAWAVVCGALLGVFWQVPFLLSALNLPRRESLLFLRGIGLMAVPMLMGMIFLKIDPLVDQSVASYLAPGRISQLNWAGRVITPFLALASGTLSTVTFPRMALKAAQGKTEFRSEAELGLRILVTLCLPAMIVLLLFARPLVHDLFERGAFLPSDTIAVAQLVQILSLTLLGGAIGEICAKMHYALKDSLTPNLLLSVLLILGYGAKAVLTPRLGITAVAAVTGVVSASCGLGLLLLAQRRAGIRFDAEFAVHVLRCCGATLVAVGVGEVVLWSGCPLSGLIGLGAGSVGYFVVLVVLDPETRLLWNRLRTRT